MFKKGLNKPPTPPKKIGGGDHNFYKEKKGGTLKEEFFYNFEYLLAPFAHLLLKFFFVEKKLFKLM